jgi:hypothetical protein
VVAAAATQAAVEARAHAENVCARAEADRSAAPVAPPDGREARPSEEAAPAPAAAAVDAASKPEAADPLAAAPPADAVATAPANAATASPPPDAVCPSIAELRDKLKALHDARCSDIETFRRTIEAYHQGVREWNAVQPADKRPSSWPDAFAVPAAPAAPAGCEFRVGDRVNYTGRATHRPVSGMEALQAAISRVEKRAGHQSRLREILPALVMRRSAAMAEIHGHEARSAPDGGPPVGSRGTVTKVAAGQVTVTFDELPPGAGSLESGSYTCPSAELSPCEDKEDAWRASFQAMADVVVAQAAKGPVILFIQVSKAGPAALAVYASTMPPPRPVPWCDSSACCCSSTLTPRPPAMMCRAWTA